MSDVDGREGRTFPVTHSFWRALAALSLAATAVVAVAPSAQAATRVDYSARCNSGWVASVHVSGYGRSVKVSIEPTGYARWFASTNVGAVWNAVWNCVHYPYNLYGWQGDGMWDQLVCHAVWSVNIGAGWTGGPTWDLESWRPNVSYSYSVQVWRHSCNW